MSNEIEFNLRDGDVDVAQKKKRVTNYEIFSMVLAEVIGTAMLVLFGCMGAVWWGKEPPRMPTPQLNFGLTVMLIIHIFGHISYALINPAVTIAAVVNKLITWQIGILLSLAQVIGASVGYGILMLITPEEIFGFPEGGTCVTAIHSSVSVTQGFFVEFLLTFTLVMMICACWNTCGGESAPLRIGLTVATLCIAGAPFTDASLNPARTFGPALFLWNWENHWVFWVAPCSAGLSASLFYRAMFWRNK